MYSEVLKQALERGWCRLNNVYEAVQMKLGHVMKDYIETQTELRQIAQDLDTKAQNEKKLLSLDDPEYEMKLSKIEDDISMALSLKELAKLLNNALYGKTLQSDEKYDESFIVKDLTEYMKKTNRRTIKDYNILAPATNDHDGIVEVKMKKINVFIKAAKYLGAAILATSQMLMKDFVYSMKDAFTDDIDICYTDTDSLYVAVYNPTVTDFQSFKSKFDPYLQELHFAKAGSIQPGQMKVEKEIVEAVFLKPKSYCYIVIVNEKEAKKCECATKVECKCKGAVLNQNLRNLTFEKYKTALFDMEKISVTNLLFKKVNKNEMYTISVNKEITWEDDKRVWYSVNESVPYGYKDHEFNEEETLNRIITNCAKRVVMTSKDLTKLIQKGATTCRSPEEILHKIHQLTVILDSRLQYKPMDFHDLLGCSRNEFKKHLKDNLHGFTFISYGKKWNIDHRQPVSDLRASVSKLCHYTNLHPMTVEENSSKGGINRTKFKK